MFAILDGLQLFQDKVFFVYYLVTHSILSKSLISLILHMVYKQINMLLLYSKKNNKVT